MTRRLIGVVLATAAALAAGCGGGSGEPAAAGWTALGPEGGPVLSLAVDPSDPETVFAGGYGGVFRSDDGGERWALGGMGSAQEVVALAVDPGKPRTLYAGSDVGVLKSTDAGNTWHPSSTGTEEASVTAIAIDPADPDTVYAGTGNAMFEIFGDSLPGVFKSTDAGETWQPVNEGLSSEPGDMIFGGGGYPGVNALVVDPEDHETVMAGTTDGLFRSADGGDHWRSNGIAEAVYDVAAVADGTAYASTESAVYRSTDGGETWQKQGKIEGAGRLAVDPAAPDVVYAATQVSGISKSTDGGRTWSAERVSGAAVVDVAIAGPGGALFAATASNGVLRSDDSGETWQPANTGLTAVVGLSVAVDPESSRTLLLGSFFNGIQRSEDGGVSWGAGDRLPGFFGYVSELLFDPSRRGGIYAAGDTVYRSDDGGESWQGLDELSAGNVAALAFGSTGVLLAAADDDLYSMSDGGESWQEVGEGLSSHGDFTALAVDPTDSDVLYAGTEDGVEKSVDGGESWQPAQMGMACDGVGSSASCAAVHALAVDPDAAQTVYAATEDGLFITSDGATSWRPAEGLPEGEAALSVLIDARSALTLYVGLNDGVFRSDDGARTWTNLDGPSDLAVTSLALDLDNSVLYVSTTAGTYAREIEAPSEDTVPLPAEPAAAPAHVGPAIDIDTVQVHSLAVDPRRPSTVYAGTSSGVAKSVDDGKSWRQAGIAGELIGDLDIDPSSSEHVYATSSTGGVFRSMDGGATWALAIACATCDLRELFLIEALAIDPKRPETVYVGMYGGVAKSTNGGDSWVESDRGMPDKPGIQAIAVDPHDSNVLFAGGNRGLWRSDDAGATWSNIGRKLGGEPFVDSVVMNPLAENVLYVAVGGPYRLMKSPDGGKTWRRLQIRGDRGGSADAIAIDPGDPRTMYVGVGDAVDGGLGLLFGSKNGGSTWTRIGSTGRKPVLSIAVAPRNHLVYAGTRSGVHVLGR